MTRIERIERRGSLVADFADRVRTALWAAIEDAPPELLVADDRSPYSAAGGADSFGHRSECERMVASAVHAAEQKLRQWL